MSARTTRRKARASSTSCRSAGWSGTRPSRLWADWTKDATGALVITDQGELVHQWTSPKRHVTKLYEVTVDRDLDAKLISVFAAGELVLEDERKPCLPARLEIVSAREARLELTEENIIR